MANIRWGARMDGTCKYKTFHQRKLCMCGQMLKLLKKKLPKCPFPQHTESWILCVLISVSTEGQLQVKSQLPLTHPVQSTTILLPQTIISCAMNNLQPNTLEVHLQKQIPLPLLFHNSVGSRPTLHHRGACQTNPQSFRWEILIPHHWGREHAVQGKWPAMKKEGSEVEPGVVDSYLIFYTQ